MKLYKGDCLEHMKTIGNESIDMILCDLPYGTTAATWDKVINFEKLWGEYNRILKPDGVSCLFSAQPFTTHLINSNLKNFRYCWYWLKNNKTGVSYARYQPMRQLEEVCVFYKKAGRYKPQGLVKFEGKDRSKEPKQQSEIYGEMRGIRRKQQYTRYPVNILKYKAVASTNRKHPTQKPVELLEYLIKTYTNEGETVLDSCMGSGSTGVACVNSNRKFIGIEKETRYFEIAKERIEKCNKQ